MDEHTYKAATSVSPNTMDRRHVLKALATTGSAMFASLPSSARAATWHVADNLDDKSGWTHYIDPPDRESATRWSIKRVSGLDHDGYDLYVAIKSGGTIPYTGVLASRVATIAPSSQRFELRCYWRFGTTTLNNQGAPSRVQAVELAINKWRSDGKRFEWAMQWENVGDGSAQQGNPPAWRLWTGIGWQDVGVHQALAPNTWHYFRLSGSISGGRVRYDSFKSRGVEHVLGQSFAPRRLAGGDELTVAFQLDGNYQQDACSIRFDRVRLRWL